MDNGKFPHSLFPQNVACPRVGLTDPTADPKSKLTSIHLDGSPVAVEEEGIPTVPRDAFKEEKAHFLTSGQASPYSPTTDHIYAVTFHPY